MSEQTTIYTESGHSFIIDGTMAPGYTISVKVVPADGYHFVQWINDPVDVGEPEYDEQLHPIFTFTIEQCGFNLSALFKECDSSCDKNLIYKKLGSLLCVEEEFTDSELCCDDIENTLNNILCKSI